MQCTPKSGIAIMHAAGSMCPILAIATTRERFLCDNASRLHDVKRDHEQRRHSAQPGFRIFVMFPQEVGPKKAVQRCDARRTTFSCSIRPFPIIFSVGNRFKQPFTNGHLGHAKCRIVRQISVRKGFNVSWTFRRSHGYGTSSTVACITRLHV